MKDHIGIASIGLKLPSNYLDVRDLAAFRDVDPNKYTRGLECDRIALCAPNEDVVSLAVGAARRALHRWGGDPSRIGLLAVGTETAKDMSRPLSAWVADELGLGGRVRSYEVKHACYAGTVALRQALEWKWSGAARGQAALVVASDIALYDEASGGEPTQGAGAVAMVVDEPTVASVGLDSFAFSEPAFDFWRPVGDPCPSVDGPLSLACFKKAAHACFADLCEARGVSFTELAASLQAVAFHVPFPKMVRKAAVELAAHAGMSDEDAATFFEEKVAPTLQWNKQCGNAYTAALWIATARALVGLDPGDEIASFSYGSGFGAELLTLSAGPGAAAGAWAADLEADLAERTRVTPEDYIENRRQRDPRFTPGPEPR